MAAIVASEPQEAPCAQPAAPAPAVLLYAKSKQQNGAIGNRQSNSKNQISDQFHFLVL